MDAPLRIERNGSSPEEVFTPQNRQIERIREVTNPVLRQEMRSCIDNVIRLRPYLTVFVKPRATLEEQFYSLMKWMDWLARMTHRFKPPESIMERIFSWLPQFYSEPPYPGIKANQEEKLFWECKHLPGVAEGLVHAKLGDVLRQVGRKLFIDSSDLPFILELLVFANKDNRLGTLQGLLGNVHFKDFPQILKHVFPHELESFVSNAFFFYHNQHHYDLILHLFRTLKPSPIRDKTLGWAIDELLVGTNKYPPEFYFPIVTELVGLISNSAKKSESEKKIKDKYKLLKIS